MYDLKESSCFSRKYDTKNLFAVLVQNFQKIKDENKKFSQLDLDKYQNSLQKAIKPTKPRMI